MLALAPKSIAGDHAFFNATIVAVTSVSSEGNGSMSEHASFFQYDNIYTNDI